MSIGGHNEKEVFSVEQEVTFAAEGYPPGGRYQWRVSGTNGVDYELLYNTKMTDKSITLRFLTPGLDREADVSYTTGNGVSVKSQRIDNNRLVMGAEKRGRLLPFLRDYMTRTTWVLFLILLLSNISSLLADEETSNRFYVVATGAWYIKCVPDGSYGEKGKTLVYFASENNDQLTYTFNWYSPRLFINGTSGCLSIVRLGPWQRGHEAKKEDLGIAFYKDTSLVAWYSTLDLSCRKDNVYSSVSHYEVMKEIVGYVDIYEKRGKDVLTYKQPVGFEIVLIDDTRLLFDVFTGDKIPFSDDIFTKRIL